MSHVLYGTINNIGSSAYSQWWAALILIFMPYNKRYSPQCGAVLVFYVLLFLIVAGSLYTTEISKTYQKLKKWQARVVYYYSHVVRGFYSTCSCVSPPENSSGAPRRWPFEFDMLESLCVGVRLVGGAWGCAQSVRNCTWALYAETVRRLFRTRERGRPG